MAEAKIIIKAQDKTKEGVNSAKSNLKDLNSVASELGINLGKLTSVAAIGVALKKLGDAAKKCCEDFLETENTYLLLQKSLGDTKSYDKAISAIDRLASHSMSSKSDIAKLYTQLVQLGKGEDEINRILEASNALAVVTGKSLTESFNIMLDSLDGSTGTLQKYLPEVKNLTKEELALGDAVDLVNDRFGEAATSFSLDSYSQQIKNIKDEFKTISEDIGYIFVNAFSPVFEWAQSVLEWFAEETSKLRDSQKKTSTVKEIRNSYEKGSVGYKVTQGYLDRQQTANLGEVGWATEFNTNQNLLRYIKTSADALEAYSAMSEAVENGAIKVDDPYVQEVFNVCKGVDANVEKAYEELKKSQQLTVSKYPTYEGGNGSSRESSGEGDSLGSTAKEDELAAFHKDVDAALSAYSSYLSKGLKDLYENSQTDAQVAYLQGLYDELVANGEGESAEAKYLKDILDNVKNKIVPGLDPASTIAAGSSYISETTKKNLAYEELLDTYNNAASILNSMILNEQNGVATYSQAEWDAMGEIVDGAASDLINFWKEEVVEKEEDTPTVRSLKEILEELYNIKNNLASEINKYSSYVSDNTWSEFSKATGLDTLDAAISNLETLKYDADQASRALAAEGKDTAVEYDLYVRVLEEIIAGLKAERNDLESGNFEFIDYINANSKYLNDANETEIEAAKNQLDATNEMIDALLSNGAADKKYLSSLYEIRDNQKAYYESLLEGEAFDFDGFLKEYSSYLSDATQELLKVGELERVCNQVNTIIDELLLSGDYSQEQLDILYEVRDGVLAQIDALKEGNKEEPATSKDYEGGFDAGKYSDYISDETLKLIEKQDAEKTLEADIKELQEIAKKANTDYINYTDQDRQEVYEALTGATKKLDEIRNGVTVIEEGLNWDDFIASFDSAFESLSSENMDAGLLGDLGSAIGEVIDAIGPILNIITSANPILALVIQIVIEFLKALAPMLEILAGPLNEALEMIGQMLAEVFLPIFDAIYPIFQMIKDILLTAITPALEMLAPVIEIVALVFKLLQPVISTVGKALEWLAAPLKFVADLFSWLGEWISYLGNCIGTAIYNISHPFSKKGYSDSPGGFSSDAFTGLKDRLAKWDEYGINTNGVSGQYDSSTSTAVSNASYTGSNNYYFNIYQQAPVVGDGGMQEFAKMIKSEFAELAYLSA